MSVSASPSRTTRLQLAVTLVAALPLLGSTCLGSNAQNPETLRHQVACAEYLNKGDLDGAETRCKLCLEYDKANPECLNGLGLINFQRDAPQEARKFYKRAMSARNDFPEARNNMGVLILQQEQNYSEAITLFQSAIKINPAYEDARLNLAKTYQIQGDLKFAEAQKRIFSKKLNDKDPAVLKSQYGDAESEYAKADDQLRRLFELNPKLYPAYFVMGYIEGQRAIYSATEALRREHVARSQQMLLRCIEIAPLDAVEAKQCRGSMAFALNLMNQCDEAMSYWLSCLAIDPKEPECRAGLNSSYACASTRTGALKKYIEQIQNNPGYAQGHLNLCVAAFEANLPDIAAASCENAIQLDKTLCLAHYNLGKHYRNVLNQEKAIGYCKSFIGCTGTQNPAEIQECKDLIAQLEVAP